MGMGMPQGMGGGMGGGKGGGGGGGDEPNNGTRLFVTQLSEGVDEEILRTYFTYFGQVKDVFVPMDKSTGTKKPFGFVTMTTPEDAQNVVTMPTHQITEQASCNVTMA